MTPKPRGRPISDEPRNQQRPVRFTEAEMVLVEHAAEVDGVTVAAFIRGAAVRAARQKAKSSRTK